MKKSKLSVREFVMLALLLLLLLGLWYYLGFYKPLQQEITDLKAQNVALDAEVSEANTNLQSMDKMKEELEEDGLAEVMSDELAALEKALEMDKERFIRLKKDEIVPFIEEEIVTRYWFQEAGVKIRLRYDRQLAQALEQVSTAK